MRGDGAPRHAGGAVRSAQSSGEWETRRKRLAIVAQMRRELTILAFSATLASGGPADAREERSEQVPNGGKFDCNLCHTDGGGSPRNPFGLQIEMMGLSGVGAIETQEVVWEELFDQDADGDGFSNGYEVGDPDGTWRIGDADPSLRRPSDPSDDQSVPCGTNAVHPDDECDGTDLDDQTCQSLGYASGTLACAADCTFDVSMCVGMGPGDMGNAGDAGPGAADAGSTPDSGGDEADLGPQNGDLGTPSVDMTGGGGSGGGGNTGGGGGGYGPYFDAPPPEDDGVRGCAGSLDVTTPDAGADMSFVALVGLLLAGWRRRFKDN